MATIRKRRWLSPSGEPRERWQVDFRDQAGKRRHKQFDRKKDADAYLVQARGQVAAGTYTPDTSSATIKEAADLWIERAEAERLERSSIVQYRASVKHLLAAIEPGTKLARLTTARCDQLRDDLLKAHSRPMAQKALKHLKGIIKDARRRGLIATNPAAETTIGAAKRHKKRLEVGVDIPTPREVKALVETATGKTLAVITLAAFAGLRASEIRGLRWPDLDLGDKPTVTISQRADRWSVIGSPKSDAARRTIPLGETSAQALRAWKLAQPPVVYREGREKRQRPHVLVFGTATDQPDTLPNLRSRVLAPAMVAAGVALPVLDDAGKPTKDKDGKPITRPKYTSLHALRHYAISSWLASGLDLKTCQHWAGHATLALTLDTYGHLIPRADDHQRIADAERGLFG
jgi:integrase